MPSPIGLRGLVTGASGGLGRYIAKALAASGVDLVLTGRDLVALNAVADTVRAQGRTATVLVADLSNQMPSPDWSANPTPRLAPSTSSSTTLASS